KTRNSFCSISASDLIALIAQSEKRRSRFDVLSPSPTYILAARLAVNRSDGQQERQVFRQCTRILCGYQLSWIHFFQHCFIAGRRNWKRSSNSNDCGAEPASAAPQSSDVSGVSSDDLSNLADLQSKSSCRAERRTYSVRP